MKVHKILVEIEVGVVLNECEVTAVDAVNFLNTVDLNTLHLNPKCSWMEDLDTGGVIQSVRLDGAQTNDL
jgi:hypothetical protein